MKLSTLISSQVLWPALAVVALLSAMAVNAETNSTESLVAGGNAFAFDLYSRLKTTDGNLFFSPYSISTCMGMVYTGARSKTAEQISTVFHFSESPEQLPKSIAALNQQLNQARGEGIELITANGLWARKGYPFLPAYLQTVENDFGARLEQVDFKKAAESARKDINNWVNQKTKGKITDPIPPGMLNPKTDIVLVNAIYFKGQWLHQFEKKTDTNAVFSISSGTTVHVPMMHQESLIGYFDSTDLQMIELPYTAKQSETNNDALSMVILLPKRSSGFKELENSLNASVLQTWLRGIHTQMINVYLPRFKMSAGFDLSATLKSLGMAEAFSDDANFSGINARGELSISEVFHQAFVDVNEEGTEAAAVTNIHLTNHALDGAGLPIFLADHPFIFLIRDTRSGSILFLGRVVDPTK